MSGAFGAPAARPQQGPPARSGRSRTVIITAAVLLVFAIAVSGFASFWTERLWYKSVGYVGVFGTVL